jgi:hypothetical protein
MYRSIGTALVVAAVATTLTTSAETLGPGDAVVPVPDEGEVLGSVLATKTIPFVATDIEGSLISTVLEGDTSSPLGGLTFTYELVLNNMSTHGVSMISVSSFADVLTDVSYTPGSATAGVAPSAADRSSDGVVVRFAFPFGDGLPSGDSSALLVVQTDAAEYVDSYASVINGDVSTADSYAPSVIPEPSMTALLLVGIAAFALWNRKL